MPVGADREGRQGYLEDGLYTEALGPEQVLWRTSRAIGLPYAGRLVGGVRLPSQGLSFFTWDPVLKRSPNRGWRRFGTDLLLRRTLRALRDFSSANPSAPRIGIGDISRPRGGDFGPRFGGLGHASHQNGLDVDLYYPRRDGRERAPRSPRQVDRRLSQELVDHFLGAGAQRVFVGAGLGLKGPRRLVVALPNHDDHLHVRFSDPSRRPRRPRRSRGSADG